jgi:hypothetical protein
MPIINTTGKILRLLSTLWIGLAVVRIGAGILGLLNHDNIVLGFVALAIAALAYKIGKVMETKPPPQS